MVYVKQFAFCTSTTAATGTAVSLSVNKIASFLQFQVASQFQLYENGMVGLILQFSLGFFGPSLK